MGTPLYMSPEQVEGKPVDPRSDVYSFGITCYHMLAGQAPFRGDNAFEVALQHVQTQAKRLEEIRDDLPPALCAIVFKMKAPKDFGDFLELRLESDSAGSFETVEITSAHQTPLHDGWVRVLVPMQQLNPYGQPFDRMRFRGKKRLSNEWVLMNEIGNQSRAGSPSPVWLLTSWARCESVYRCA